MPERLCIYGTIYNNALWVEDSIKSVWRPDAEIVIIDNYSTDGTWEKLLEMRREYGLRVYRYKCSRGLGRNIALHKCPEGSIAAYFDLDTVYNEAFHKVLDYSLHTGLRVLGGTLVARREYLLRIGGWRELNYGEDVEFISRAGFDLVVPAVVGQNAVAFGASIMRERRYGGICRIVSAAIDSYRGHALTLWRAIYPRPRTLFPTYFMSLVLGHYRNRRPDNATWVELASLVRLVPLSKLDIPERYFWIGLHRASIKLVAGGEKSVEEKIITKLVSKP